MGRTPSPCLTILPEVSAQLLGVYGHRPRLGHHPDDPVNLRILARANFPHNCVLGTFRTRHLLQCLRCLRQFLVELIPCRERAKHWTDVPEELPKVVGRLEARFRPTSPPRERCSTLSGKAPPPDRPLHTTPGPAQPVPALASTSTLST